MPAYAPYKLAIVLLPFLFLPLSDEMESIFVAQFSLRLAQRDTSDVWR